MTSPEASKPAPTLTVIHFPPPGDLNPLVEGARAVHQALLDPTSREFPDDDSNLTYVLIVAHEGDGKVVGYATFEVLPAHYDMWWGKWVLVDPRSRRSGIGRRLLAKAGERAGSMGVRKVCLEPFHETPEIENWYLGLGFSVVEEDNGVPSRYLCMPAGELARL